ncbi:hypothetical protein V6C27_03115 [Peptococcaceae bacterium 1198_IL3148]
MDHNVTPQEYLAALIEIYRGYMVDIPKVDDKLQLDLLKDVLSSAIRFAESERAVQTISEELFNCAQGKCNFAQQIEAAKVQSPEVLTAKMTAAAYIMKLHNSAN